MTRLIGITGKAGSGKDTMKEMILELRPEYEAYSFARKLKDTAEFMFGWTQEQIEDREFKEAIDPEWGFSPRRAMQLLGTEFGRALREDLWLLFATKKLREVTAQGKGLILADVRFENEASWIRDNDGILIHIEAPLAKEVNLHSSENGVAFQKGDFCIYNDLTSKEGLLADIRLFLMVTCK